MQDVPEQHVTNFVAVIITDVYIGLILGAILLGFYVASS
jgi:hypothetical protein